MRVSQHRSELLKAREELAELLRKREEIEVEVARQRRKVAAWAEVCDEGEYAEANSNLVDVLGVDLGGLTDVCRTAMRASRKEWMTIADIQTAITELGFPLNKYKAPAASITTTINRLANAREVKPRRQLGKTNEYKWIGQAMYGLTVDSSRKGRFGGPPVGEKD